MAHRPERMSNLRRRLDASRAHDPGGGPRATRPRLAAVRRSHLLLALLFLTATVFILEYGQPPLGVQLGEVAPYTIEATVPFKYDDPYKLEQMLLEAMDQVPNRYGPVPAARTSDANAARPTAFDRASHLIHRAVKEKDYGDFLRGVDERFPELRRLPELKVLHSELQKRSPGQIESIRQTLGLLKDEFNRESAYRNILDPDDYEKENRKGLKPIFRLDNEEEPEEREYTSLTRVRRLQRARTITLISADEKPLAEPIAAIVTDLLKPTLILDAEITNEKRQQEAANLLANDPGVGKVEVERGEILVRRGQLVNELAMLKIRAEGAASYAAIHAGDPRRFLRRVAGLTLGLFAIGTAFGAVLVRYEPSLFHSQRKLIVYGILNLLIVLAAKLIVLQGWSYHCIPVALAAMIGALMFSGRVAVIGTVGLALLVGAATGYHAPSMMSLLIGSLIAIVIVERAEQRPSIPWAGAMAGLFGCVTAVGFDLFAGADHVRPILLHGGWSLLNGLVTGVVVLGTLTHWESLFGVTTNIKLLELSDQNHDALRDLERHAPGTYQHSLRVGTLCEAACEVIGADALLARVAAYYHDIGKIPKPEYFVENAVPGRSRHNGISPHMSAIIIINHVKDGEELSHEYGLPQVIRDLICQHHGTTRVDYFYRKAVEQAQSNSHPAPSESFFRYPGPKPQTREAAVMLLADTVEAASRTLEDPSPARLEAFVRELSRHKLDDGQYDECPLTMAELREVEDAIYRQLCSMFHKRIPYPKGIRPGDEPQ